MVFSLCISFKSCYKKRKIKLLSALELMSFPPIWQADMAMSNQLDFAATQYDGVEFGAQIWKCFPFESVFVLLTM